MKSALSLCLAAALIVVGCNKNPSSTTTKKETLPATTAEVVRQDITGYVFVDGKVYSPPGTQAEVRAPYTVPLKEVYVRVGERVRKGEPIAKMDMPGADESVAMAQSYYNSAKSAYNAALSSNGGPVGEAQQALRDARAAEAAAKADVLNGGSSDVAAATQERVAAEERLKAAQREAGSMAFAEKQALDSAAAYLAEAKSGAREGLLRSPIAGTVVRLDATVGMKPESGQAIAVVCDLSQIEVQGTVPAEHADLAKEGAEVLIAMEGANSEPIEGKIKEISVLPPAEGQASAGYLAVVKFDNSQSVVQPGMKIKRLGLRTGHAEDVLVVPVGAITKNDQGQTVAQLRSGTEWVTKTVEIGISDGALIQVKSGVNEGDIVHVRERTVTY